MNYPDCLLYVKKPETEKTQEKPSETPRKVTSWRSRVKTNPKQATRNEQKTREA
ncbi:MAG: hypothetical protein IKS41_06145 [Alphaproteobacteria bacterium]|nr:hypothetical protein [Alphaproteobacteria bacterium]